MSLFRYSFGAEAQKSRRRKKMSSLLKRVFLVSFIGVFLAGSALAKETKATIRFVYTGDLGAVYYDYRRPSEALITSFETKIGEEKKKKTPVVFLDTGHFIAPPVVSETTYMSRPVRFFQHAEFGAINLTPRELIAGLGYFEAWEKLSPPPPFVTSMRLRASGKPLTALSRSLEVSGVKIGIIGATDVKNVSALPDIVKQFDTPDVIPSLKAEVANLSANNDLVMVLSDLEPAANDNLATEATDVDVILENSQKQDNTVRKVGKTLIASRSGTFAYDALTIKLEGAHTISEYKPEAVFFGPKPGEKAYSDMIPLAEIGAELPNIDLLKRLYASFEGLEIIRTIADFQDSRITNSLIYYYKMYKGSTLLGDAYYVRHHFGAGHLGFDFLVLLDLQNKVKDFKLLSSMALGMQSVEVYDFRADIIGKSPDKVEFKMEKLRGVEKYFQFLKEDLAALAEINAKVLQRRFP
jgi:hypothetical protein